MKKYVRRIAALLLALCMMLSLVACNGAMGSANLLIGVDGLGASKIPVVESASDEMEELTREELETIIDALDPEIDTSTLTDKELSNLADGLLNNLDKDTGAIDVSENKGAYDENGAMVKPFDQVYPELIEEGAVEYSDESILIKMSNAKGGKITAAMEKCGVAKLEEIVPLETATWYKASLKKGIDAQAALTALRELNEVLLAEYDYKIQTAAMDSYQELDSALGLENNSKKKDQWYLNYCGIPAGFNYMKYDGGKPSVIVAVIDTGVDIDHEDLSHNIWKNTKEKPGNGIDDDGNGYVDDYYGVNIVSGRGNGDDDNGHGTHVAGIIAAQNNNIGTVGIAHKVTIMPVKAAAASGYFLQSDIAKAVLYAYENGAEVINMSFGGSACSIAVQDALATAYTRCVLVASAGNDGMPNEGMFALPSYPAALTYVLGVMAVDQSGRETTFTNYDVKLYNGVEYELYAPGYNIMSTLPGDRYGSLSGTSMAAPVVSAMAAILRSEFEDRDTYPTKFIYGQLTATSDYYATCLNPDVHGLHNLPQIANLYAALTKLPQPDVGLQDFLIFDTEDLGAKNNGDGVIDAGETISLGLILRNRWGMSKNTMVTVDTLSFAGVSDPYVTFVNPTVDYDTVGTYSTQDCGKIFTDELHTGWENPFILKIAEDCPNDYIITINVRLQYENGLDDKDKTVYTAEGALTITVRNGVVLPSIIDEDMVLTSDNLYIIPSSTVITEGTTVRVRPGTHIQFWSDDPSDPYADTYIAYLLVKGKFLVEGTKEDPVYIYPSDLMDMYNVEMSTGGDGYISLTYADVTNLSCPRWSYNVGCNISYADHCTFRMNYGLYKYARNLDAGQVHTNSYWDWLIARFGLVENSVFYKLGFLDGSYRLFGSANRCIFADCGIQYSESGEHTSFQNCVFLGNTFLDQTQPNVMDNSSMTMPDVYMPGADDVNVFFCEETGITYILTYNQTDAFMLDKLGIHPLVVNDGDELCLLRDEYGIGSCIAVEYTYVDGTYCWYDGTPIGAFLDTVNNCLSGEGDEDLYLYLYGSGGFLCEGTGVYVYEMPGQILPTDITFSEYEVDIDTDTTYQIAPQNQPVQLGVDAFIYESRDDSVVKVSKTGLVTPVGAGTADVYVYSEDRAVYNYVTFNVVDYVALEDFTFTAPKSVIAVGERMATDVTFAPVNTTRKQVTYTSSNPAVVKVDAAGNLTGVTAGTATITATCEGMEKTIEVTIYLQATKVEFASLATTMTVEGGAKDLPAVITNAGAETDLVWRSIDTAVAVIEDGKIIPKANGTTTIEVKDLRSGLSAAMLLVVGDTTSPVKKVEHTGYVTAVLLENGDLYTWNYEHATPALLTTGVKDVMGSDYHLCVVKTDNTISVYYYSSYVGLYVMDTQEQLKGRTDVESVFFNASSGYSFYALTTDGTVYAWGYNAYGRLGIGSYTDVNEPTLVNLDGVVDMAVYSETAYFLTEEGVVYYAGHSAYKTAFPTRVMDGVKELLWVCDLCTVLCQDGSIRSYYLDGKQHSKCNGVVVPDDATEVTMGYYANNGSTIGYGAYLLNGKVYMICYQEGIGMTTKELVGIRNATRIYTFNESHYIATADGLLYGYGTNYNNNFAGVSGESVVLNPVPVLLNRVGEQPEVVSCTQQGDEIRLTFNKELISAYAKLYAGDVQITLTQKIVNINELIISRSNGFTDGTEYRLVFAAGAIHCAGGVTNAEEVVVTFTYDADAATPEIPADPENPADPEEEIKVPVIHQSVTDTTVERILTAERFVANYQAVRDEYQYNSQFYHNVMLNRISADTTVEHWLRLLAPETAGEEVPLGQNYWGTTNETAIGYQLIDYSDFITYGRFMYAPYLTEAPEDTFPFVTSVQVLNKDKEVVTTVGNEQITVRVTFNRDMDTSIPLQVRFGSAYPYGDYEIEGKYVDARTWEGKYKLTTIIEGGIQYFTIENGCSATDDLVLMRDRARFTFEIDTTAAQALIMQGEATDTGINLSWTQDDFDTLMGYNVYRSTSEDGYYTRVNTSVIPADVMTFFDDTVEPGVVYYYNFTVVQTDLSESIPSGKIVIMSKDTMAPNIYHSPVYNATTGSNLMISATVTDNLNIAYAYVYYRTKGETEWRIAVMNSLNDKYSAIIVADHVTVEGLEYYIEAFDGVSYTYKGSAENPYLISVQEVVAGDAMGDVNGDGAITNLDALMLLKAINDQLNLNAEQFARADLNGDGTLSAVEALRILQYVSGAVGTVDMRS